MRVRRNTPVPLRVGLIAGLALLTGVLFGLAHPAYAKGPESVTITGPGIDGSLELMSGTNNDQIARLMEQSGIWYGTGDLPRAIPGPPEELGPRYLLTWVNSGPPNLSVAERTIIQEIYLDTELGPVIHTPDQASLNNWGSGVIGWFTAPEGLRETLAGLGAPLSRSPTGRTVSSLIAQLDPAEAVCYLSVAGVVLVVMLVAVWRARRLVRSH